MRETVENILPEEERNIIITKNIYISCEQLINRYDVYTPFDEMTEHDKEHPRDILTQRLEHKESTLDAIKDYVGKLKILDPENYYQKLENILKKAMSYPDRRISVEHYNQIKGIIDDDQRREE